MNRGRRQTEHRQIRFGSREINFSLLLADRKDLAITVHPDLRVSVTAPRGHSDEEVCARVRRRAAWITRQLTRFEQLHPLPSEKRYVSGETHRYLGRQYRLKVVRGEEEGVKLSSPFIVVTAKNVPRRSRLKELVDRWYRERAHVMLPRYVTKCLSSAKSLEVGQPRIQIRRLAKRWGSCTKLKTILLNTELVRTPPYCIEYVIVHELCHLQVHDHSPRFFQLLTRCMPDWSKRKARLDAFTG